MIWMDYLLSCWEKFNFQMKKLNSIPYQRNTQEQDDRNSRPDRMERVDRLRENLKLNQYAMNTDHYRKHNSPDANKLRNFQNQNHFFLSKNVKPKNPPENNTPRQDYNKYQLQPNYPGTQSTGHFRQLPKTASSPRLIQQSQQQAYENDQKRRQQLYTQTDEYKKLHQKLNSIEDKIMNMKKNIQRKREQKQKLIEKQKKEKSQQQKRVLSEQKSKSKKNPLKGLVTQMPEHGQLHTFERNPYSPRHNIYYISQVVRAYLDQKSLARQHILTSLHILRILQKSQPPSDQQMRRRRIDMPIKKGKQNKKCIVFDLDETLIHCNDSLTPPHDVKLPITFPTGEVIEAGINVRPHAKEILKNLSKNFQVIVFTASHSCYANVVLDYLDPNNEYIDYRLYRQHCYQTQEGMYVKDLRVLGRDLKDVALVDNAAYSYAFQLDNGIPILPYYHGSQDYQLITLEKFFNSYLTVDDVRAVNSKTFHLTRYQHYYGEPQRLVEELYMNEEVQTVTTQQRRN